MVELPPVVVPPLGVDAPVAAVPVLELGAVLPELLGLCELEPLCVDPPELGAPEPLPALPPFPVFVLDPDDELRSLASAVSALATAVSSC